jgi:hypothetical protein
MHNFIDLNIIHSIKQNFATAERTCSTLFLKIHYFFYLIQIFFVWGFLWNDWSNHRLPVQTSRCFCRFSIVIIFFLCFYWNQSFMLNFIRFDGSLQYQITVDLSSVKGGRDRMVVECTTTYAISAYHTHIRLEVVWRFRIWYFNEPMNLILFTFLSY